MNYTYIFILILIGGVVGAIGHYSSMLRTEIINIENFRQLVLTKGIKNPRPAYSLARTQLAIWSVVITSSFLYSMIANSFPGIKIPPIDPVNLLLLGIAGGTTAVGKVIDTSQKNNPGTSIPQQDQPSKGFFMDLISDEKGVSIHRLQNVLWTIIVAFIYIASVMDKKQLPDNTVINNQLLGLMGISAGAYLGLKTSENQNAPVGPTSIKAGTITDDIKSNISQPVRSVLTQDKIGTL